TAPSKDWGRFRCCESTWRRLSQKAAVNGRRWGRDSESVERPPPYSETPHRTCFLEYCTSAIGLPKHPQRRCRIGRLRSFDTEIGDQNEDVSLGTLFRRGSDSHGATPIRGTGLCDGPVSVLLHQFLHRWNELLYLLARTMRISRTLH